MIGGLDIGGTKIAAGIVDSSGKLHACAECSTEPERGFTSSLDRIAKMLLTTSEHAGGRLEGIGIGCTGPVDPQTGVIGKNSFLPTWEGRSLTDALTNRTNIPTAIENDADAAALGESIWGTGQGIKNFIYITVSTGIGGGLVFDGRLYRGVDGSHPEVGHHVIDPSGPQCFCGARGCWESLASGPALARWFKEHYPEGLNGNNEPDARAICEAAPQGDPRAREAAAREGYYLGLGFANLVTLFTPDVIALGGGVMRSWPLFSDRVGEVIRTTCGLVPYEKVHLVPAALGADVGILGAACVWLHHMKET